MKVESYKEAKSVYNGLRGANLKRNRKVTITAIARTLHVLSNNPDSSISIPSRSSLNELPRLILTHTHIKHLSTNDLHVLADLSKYLRGEVG